MSRHHIEKVTCPSCHHEGDFELWDSINTALDPEMKEKVLNLSHIPVPVLPSHIEVCDPQIPVYR